MLIRRVKKRKTANIEFIHELVKVLSPWRIYTLLSMWGLIETDLLSKKLSCQQNFCYQENGSLATMSMHMQNFKQI